MHWETFAVRLINALLGPSVPDYGPGLSIGQTVGERPIDLIIPMGRRFEHVVCLGKTGAGKTHCLENFAIQHIARREGFLFLDFHGDATEHLVALASEYPEAAERLTIIDLTDPQASPGLNPLEINGDDEHAGFARTAELTSILKQRWGADAFGARSEELLRNSLYTLAVNGNTLMELPTLLTSRAFRAHAADAVRNEAVASYWSDRYEPLSDAMKAVFREPLLNKITGFLTDPICRHLLGQTRSTFSFRHAMGTGRWVLVNLCKGKLRDHAHTLGNLIFAKVQFDVMARVTMPEGRRRLFSIICDEVQNLAENDLITLLAEGRKFGVSLITANQFWEQLPKELRGALLSAGTHVFFRISAHDAAQLAPELAVHARQKYLAELTTLPKGEAIVRVGWSAPEHIRVPAHAVRRRNDALVERVRALAIARSSRPRAEIEAEIHERRALWRHTAVATPTPDTDVEHTGQTSW